MIFLGLASNYSARAVLRHTFAFGSKTDRRNLELALSNRCASDPDHVSLAYSGRSAIYFALKSFIKSGRINPGDAVAVNAFTCIAVIEGIKAAGLKPIFIDIEKSPSGTILPNYSASALEKIAKSEPSLKVFILQNTFGVTVPLAKFEKVKKKYNLLVIEDTAHCFGKFYPILSAEQTSAKNLVNLPVGTFGDAVVFSFGKGKVLDSITGGAVVLRNPNFSFSGVLKKSTLSAEAPASNILRARFYPLFGAIARSLSYLHLEKFWLGFLLKVHWIERSADTDLKKRASMSNWQAKLILKQLDALPESNSRAKKSPLLREYFLVSNRDACLAELKKHGFRLEEIWYDTPVAPKRYFSSVQFPSGSCPNAVFFANHVVNLPTWYTSKRKKNAIKSAKQIIKKYEIK